MAMSANPPFVVVPWQELSEAALRGVLEAFVGREGTDYGAREVTFESKIQDVLAQLRRGDASVVFDPRTESINIVRTDELPGARQGRNTRTGRGHDRRGRSG